MPIRKGTLKAFDNTTKKATVQMDGSLSLYLTEVPVSRELTSAEMTAGRTVAIAFFDEGNPEDAMVVGVF
ncbi:MAG: hypothetical protein HYY02_09445 [Chloroflexi bacterium]|nr:hypothetical protein [Chloroflexota bacterium]